MGRVKTGKTHSGTSTAGRVSVRARRKAGTTRAAYQKRINQILKGLRNLPIDPLERLDVLIPRVGLARTSWPMWVSSPDKAQALCDALQKEGPNARDVTPVLMDLLDHVERHFRVSFPDLQLECGNPSGALVHQLCHDRFNPPLQPRCWGHIIKACSLPSDLPVIIVKELMESLDAAHSRFMRKRHMSIAKAKAKATAATVALDQSVEYIMPKSPFAKRLVRVHTLLHTPWTEPRPQGLIEEDGGGTEDPDLQESETQVMEIDEDEEGYDLRDPDDHDESSSENGSFMFREDWEGNEPDTGDHDLLLGASARPITEFAQSSPTRRPFGSLAQLLSSAPSAGQKIDISQVDFQGSTSSLAFGPSAHSQRVAKQGKDQ
jgi:hypothetical protein